MSRMAKVDVFYENGTVPTTNYLEEIFTDVTNVSPNDDPLHLFSAIMLPVRDYDSTNNKLSDNYTYHNVGLTTTELADLYWTQYSGTYLIGAGNGKTLSEDAAKLKLRCRAIFRKNYGKYLKMIEMEGLVWNPLWNVDGTELRQILENNGTTDVETGGINTTAGVQWNDNKTTHSVSSYDGALKDEYTDETNGSGSNRPTGIQRVTYSNNDFVVNDQGPSGSTISQADETTVGTKGSTKYIHNNAKNIVNGSDTDYTVSSGDTAFGYALTGGDKMHVEKYVRQGNIGVTETTTLLEHARQYLRFSVVQEFFNDINKVILIGIYGDIAPVPWWEVGQSSGGGGTSTEHPDTGRITSVYNNLYDMIQSVELDEYGHVIGLTTCDGVTRMSTPLTQAEYDETDPKDLPLYYIYETDDN